MKILLEAIDVEKDALNHFVALCKVNAIRAPMLGKGVVFQARKGDENMPLVLITIPPQLYWGKRLWLSISFE